MKTDWNRIRTMMNTAIDACERIEEMGYSEEQRGMESKWINRRSSA